MHLEHVITSDAIFKFYTSFSNYATFKAFFNYLQLVCNFLLCAEQKIHSIQAKRGTQKSLKPEQELFKVFVPLRCGLLGLDIAQYSRIETTWLAFLYQRLRALPM